MPSADCWVPFPPPFDGGSSSWSRFPALPGYDALTSALIAAASTARLSGQELDFEDNGLLVSIVMPFMRFLFIGAAFCLWLPSDSASRLTPLPFS